MSDSKKNMSLETRLKISASNKKNGSRPPGQKGIPCSEETKRKLREYNLGKVLSEETKNKISFASANRSDDAKKNKSDGLKLWWEKRKKNVK